MNQTQTKSPSQEPQSSLFSKLWKHQSSSSSSSDDSQSYQHLHDGLLQWHHSSKEIVQSIASLATKPIESRVNQLKRIAGVSVTIQKSHGDLQVALEIELQRPKGLLSGGLYTPGKNQLFHQITRPFAEFRTLRKVLKLWLKQKQCPVQTCAFCNELSGYIKTCWEQPPLVVMQRSTGATIFQNEILAKSMLSLVEFARSEPPQAPDCQARVSFALALCDFLRLDDLEQRTSASASGNTRLIPPVKN